MVKSSNQVKSKPVLANDHFPSKPAQRAAVSPAIRLYWSSPVANRHISRRSSKLRIDETSSEADEIGKLFSSLKEAQASGMNYTWMHTWLQHRTQDSWPPDREDRQNKFENNRKRLQIDPNAMSVDRHIKVPRSLLAKVVRKQAAKSSPNLDIGTQHRLTSPMDTDEQRKIDKGRMTPDETPRGRKRLPNRYFADVLSGYARQQVRQRDWMEAHAWSDSVSEDVERMLYMWQQGRSLSTLTRFAKSSPDCHMEAFPVRELEAMKKSSRARDAIGCDHGSQSDDRRAKILEVDPMALDAVDDLACTLRSLGAESMALNDAHYLIGTTRHPEAESMTMDDVSDLLSTTHLLESEPLALDDADYLDGVPWPLEAARRRRSQLPPGAVARKKPLVRRYRLLQDVRRSGACGIKIVTARDR